MAGSTEFVLTHTATEWSVFKHQVMPGHLHREPADARSSSGKRTTVETLSRPLVPSLPRKFFQGFPCLRAKLHASACKTR